MRISELIKKLQEYSTDLDVYISIGNVDCEVNNVSMEETDEESYVILSNC